MNCLVVANQLAVETAKTNLHLYRKQTKNVENEAVSWDFLFFSLVSFWEPFPDLPKLVEPARSETNILLLACQMFPLSTVSSQSFTNILTSAHWQNYFLFPRTSQGFGKRPKRSAQPPMVLQLFCSSIQIQPFFSIWEFLRLLKTKFCFFIFDYKMPDVLSCHFPHCQSVCCTEKWNCDLNNQKNQKNDQQQNAGTDSDLWQFLFLFLYIFLRKS